MKKVIKFFILITVVFSVIGILMAIFESDESRMEYELHTLSISLWEVESVKNVDEIYIKLDELQNKYNDSLLDVKVDSLKKMKSKFYEIGKSKEREVKYASAYIAAKEFIEKRLKAPSTAKFASYVNNEVKFYYDEKKGHYFVNMWVDAQNSFGAMIRSTYWVELEDLGGQWRLIEITED